MNTTKKLQIVAEISDRKNRLLSVTELVIKKLDTISDQISDRKNRSRIRSQNRLQIQ